MAARGVRVTMTEGPLLPILALATPLGLLGIWWSYPIANAATAILCIFWFVYGPWRRSLVAAEGQARSRSVPESERDSEGRGNF
jgi:Na+-driven multidrug efflux pump